MLVTIASFISIPTIMSQLGSDSIYLYIAIVASIIGVVTFVIVEKRVKEPIIDMRLMKIKGVYMSSIIVVFTNFCTICLIYSLSFFAASRGDWSAVEVGMISTFVYICTSMINFLMSFVINRLRTAYFVVIGASMYIIGSIFFTNIEATSSYMYVLMTIGIVGLGSGFINPALMKLVMDDLPGNLKGAGSGVYLIFVNIGVPFGSTIGLALFSLFGKQANTMDATVAAAHALTGIGYIVIAAAVLIVLLAIPLMKRTKKPVEEAAKEPAI